jgi:signal transduction histidine kinase
MQKCLDTIELVRKKGLLDEDVTRMQLDGIDLSEQVQSVISDFEDTLFTKGILVENEVPPGLMICAERASLNNIVISNVLSNAIKFSYPNSRVILSASQEETQVSLFIKDFGIGIPTYLLPMVFDPKKVTRRAGTLNEQGTGYGMGLVKKLMGAYKGNIRVESTSKSQDNRNHGTTVELVFRKPIPRVEVEPEED